LRRSATIRKSGYFRNPCRVVRDL
jgi:Nuclease-related domain